eukprot:scaffold51711_cov66-Attheya_sp.AAC.7
MCKKEPHQSSTDGSARCDRCLPDSLGDISGHAKSCNCLVDPGLIRTIAGLAPVPSLLVYKRTVLPSKLASWNQ